MTATVIIGTQWGDEGKGKITDLYAKEYDYIVRFQGGNNAGHTLVVEGITYKLHLIPSGILYPNKHAVIGNGLVVDPEVFLDELAGLAKAGIDIKNLHVSERAHVIMPYHKIQDAVEEELKGGFKAGTTKRGIGPCYQDKVGRFGIRMADLLNPEVRKKKIDQFYPVKKKFLAAFGADIGMTKEELLQWCAQQAKLMAPYVEDTSLLLNRALENGEKVLLEGAQGTHLCIDHGIYPFGTSSNCVSANGAVGAGIGPGRIENVVGVVKAYTTRVGTGPFPTELFDDVGERIAEKGGEFGTTTGRPRRVGWLDLVMLRFSARVNGLTSLALTKADVMEGLEEIKVATHYEKDGVKLEDFPADMDVLAKCEPVYDILPGWPELGQKGWEAVASKGKEALPENLLHYVEYLEKALDVPVELVSLGPARNAYVLM